MAVEAAFRELVKYAVGGRWGDEVASPEAVAVRVIRGTDCQSIASGSFDQVPRRFEARMKAERRFLQPNDIVLEISGGSRTSDQSTGRSFLVTEEVLARLGGQVIPASFCRLLRLDDNVIQPRFGYYALQEMYRSGRAGLYEHHSTGISNFQFEYFLDQERVLLPDLPQQCAIAHILGTLDDKIELNRRMNETLEAMARALFKSWFVNFDPVRAKAAGRDPGLPKRLADLFPARLVESELGEIPEGWEVGTFGDLVEVLRDQENPLESPGASFRHFSIPAFDDGQWPKRELGETIKSLKSRVAPGVVLLSKLNPEIERVWMVDVRPGERAVCSTEFLVLRARPPFTRGYVYCLTRSPLFRQQVEGLVTGTSKSHQRAQVESILNLAAVMPPSSVVAVDLLPENWST